MQIIAPGQPLVQPRKTFAELYASSPPAKFLKERRLRIIANTTIRGQLVWPGSVFTFDLVNPEYYEDFACLTGSLKAERVSNEVPLHTAAAPTTPPPFPVAPVAERKESPGVMELAKALLTAMKELSQPRAGKA